jgi:tellurite resistance protein TehA-like permease
MLTSHSILYIGKVARKLLEGSDILDPIAGPMAYVLGVFISLIMWSFGLIWLVFALATVVYSSPFPFNMGWWGFTFPLGVYAANSIELGIELDLTFFKVFGTVCPYFMSVRSCVWITNEFPAVLDFKCCCTIAMGSCWVPHSNGGLARKLVLCALSSKSDF